MEEPNLKLLEMSWHDSVRIQILNPQNVMDYFMHPSNPFFDRTCNNEIVKMQRLSADQLSHMTGIEYVLLFHQKPVLYVIRKQHRHSAGQVTPLALCYIINGVVYQAPDLGTVINSRLLSSVNHLQAAFDEFHQKYRYDSCKGYWWDYKDHEDEVKPEPVTFDQRQRVDLLIADLARKFPPKGIPAPEAVVSEQKPPLPSPSQPQLSLLDSLLKLM